MQKVNFDVYIEHKHTLHVDPHMLKRKIGEEFVNYTLDCGRKTCFKLKTHLLHPFQWNGMAFYLQDLSLSGKMCWIEPRARTRDIIWSMWNKVVATNMWWVKFMVDVDDKCHMLFGRNSHKPLHIEFGILPWEFSTPWKSDGEKGSLKTTWLATWDIWEGNPLFA